MKKFFDRKKKFDTSSKDALTECVKFTEESLKELQLDKKPLFKTLLVTEEAAVQIIRHAAPGAEIHVRVRRILADASVSLSCDGVEYDPYVHLARDSSSIEDMEDEDAQKAVRAILLKSQGENFKFSHKGGVNSVRIMAGGYAKSQMKLTVAALFLGILFGLLLQNVFPQAASDTLSKYILTPIRTMFMNSLKIIVGPVIFFSLVSCFSQFKDLSELGRIGAKVMGMYLLTTVIAVLLGFSIFYIIEPGTIGFATHMAEEIQEVSINTDADTSLLHTIVNIVPANFVRPFLESETLQIIFLAIICGIAVGMIGEYSATLQNLFEAFNSLFLTITTIISRFIPIAVFCSMAIMVKGAGGKALFSVLSMFGADVLAFTCMMIIYGILILILGRLNPITFFKKDLEGMVTGITLASSSAAMPTNMRICTDKLGISPKICNFSIPLGATVNMDGSCINLVITGLFLARAYDIPVPVSALFSLGLTIILLSLGSPGVPGAGLVCISIVLAAIGVPLEGVGLIMGVYSILDMFITMSNTTGDVAAALIVAKSENLLDMETFNNKEL